MANTLRQRLLRDIAEIQEKPYPNIAFHPHDSNLEQACLILTVEGYGNLHLTVKFHPNYPLSPPYILMDSDVKHPNVYNRYICSSILNTTGGYTSAYTLKGIAIQLLSFFSSDKVEQVVSRRSVSLDKYKSLQAHIRDTYTCSACQFGTSNFNLEALTNPELTIVGQEELQITSLPGIIAQSTGEREADTTASWPTIQEALQASSSTRSSPLQLDPSQRPMGRNARRREAKGNAQARAQVAETPPVLEEPSSSFVGPSDLESQKPAKLRRNLVDMKLPSEVIMLIADLLDTEDLLSFAGAWARIPQIMASFDILRTRELQCFCLKQDWKKAKLGVGVHVDGKSLESEFDLLSSTGFYTHNIRRSTQGLPFEHWLPLPISYGHWRKVAEEVPEALTKLGYSTIIPNPTPVKVLVEFMNGIVVKLNQAASMSQFIPSHKAWYADPYGIDSVASSLTHASEKAIESYFHLFHLLICLATENPIIVTTANNIITNFVSGRTSKTDCPNLGHLLIAALISNVEMTEPVIKAIIKETVTRNVVWMLQSNPELAYLEPSAVSEYRLHHTFQASKTSYRLLMFLNLFRKAAVGTPRKDLAQLRNEAFDRHGAPPRGTAKGLADAIKRIHEVDRFPDFFVMMDIKGLPTKEQFNRYLHDRIKESGEKGYSRMVVTQGEALALREAKEPTIAVRRGLVPTYRNEPIMRGRSFFPANRGSRDGYRGGHRGGRGGRSYRDE